MKITVCSLCNGEIKQMEEALALQLFSAYPADLIWYCPACKSNFINSTDSRDGSPILISIGERWDKYRGSLPDCNHWRLSIKVYNPEGRLSGDMVCCYEGASAMNDMESRLIKIMEEGVKRKFGSFSCAYPKRKEDA